MRCSKCGQELNMNNAFCPNCGRRTVMDKKTDESSKGIESEYDNLYNAKLDIPNFHSKSSKNKPSRIKPSVKKDRSETAAALDENYMEETGEDTKLGSRIKSFFIGLLVTILLIGAAIFAGYYAYNHFIGSSSSEYVDSVSKLSTSVNKTNSDMAAAIKKDTSALAVSDILKQIAKTCDEFNDISTSFDKIIAPSVYSKSNEKLDEAIKLNKLIYQQLETILRNPVLPDTQKNMEQLTKSIDECTNNYADVNVKGINISLPNEILAINSRLQPWVKQKQSEYSQITSLITAFSNYFDNMAKLFSQYDSAAYDFNQLIRSVRNGQEPWEKLFTQIDNSEKGVKAVKDAYLKLSVPTELSSVNKRFGPILDEHLAYYGSLRLAAQAERDSKKTDAGSKPGTTQPGGTQPGGTQPGTTQQGTTKPTTTQPTNTQAGTVQPGTTTTSSTTSGLSKIEAMYQEAEKHYSSASMEYQKFAIDLKSEKDRYLDPEFVLKLKSKK